MSDNEVIKDTKQKKGKKEKKKKGKRKLRKWVLITILVILALCVIGVGVAFGVIFGLIKGEWSLSEADLEIEFANSTIVDMDGNVIGTLNGDENRIIISKDQMSKYLEEAFISIEDERFETHKGVDLKRTLGATLNFVTHKGSSSYGGSTITQQCVKNLTGEDDSKGINGVLRKVKEMARAYQLEKIWSKDQIIELYLNLIPLGGDVYGVEMASRKYFNKSASDLTVVEAAYLAGITNAPSTYNPFGDNAYGTDEAKTARINKRVKSVCYKMNELGRLNDEDYKKALEEIDSGIKFQQGTTSSNSNHSYHTEAAIKQVLKELMAKNNWSEEEAKLHLYGGAYTIHTTQDTKLQQIVQEAYLNKDWIQTRNVTKKDENGNDVKEKEQIQSGMVIIDHSTGYVVAGAGALGEKTAWGVNRMVENGSQPGSSIKPLAVVAPSLQEGLITAASVEEDSPVSFGTYRPKNDKQDGYYGLMNIRYILRVSRNIPEVRLMAKLTPEKSMEYLKNMGISSIAGDEGLSLALGGLTNGVSPLEMAGAYATIANYGVYIEPTFYTKVESSTGKVLIEKQQETHRVFSEQNAWILQSLLTEPTGTGLTGSSGATATGAVLKGYQTSGKTGTSNDNLYTWFCGFTPYYTASMYFGYDSYDPHQTKYGDKPQRSGTIARRWASIMKKAHEGLEAKRFDMPSGITTAKVCTKSGLLASDLCTSLGTVYTEYFATGTVPKSTCSSHNQVSICSQTNLLAHEGCPYAVKKLFIEKQNEDGTKFLHSADDETFILPTETCPHDAQTPVTPGVNDPTDPNNPSGGNNTTDPNNPSGGNNTTDPNNPSGGNTTNPDNSVGGNNTTTKPPEGNNTTNSTGGENVNNTTV